MTTITITVPEELSEEIDSWLDGESYTLNVTQTASGQFDLVSTGVPEPELEEEVVEEEMIPAKRKMPPSIAYLAGKKQA